MLAYKHVQLTIRVRNKNWSFYEYSTGTKYSGNTWQQETAEVIVHNNTDKYKMGNCINFVGKIYNYWNTKLGGL